MYLSKGKSSSKDADAIDAHTASLRACLDMYLSKASKASRCLDMYLRKACKARVKLVKLVVKTP
jgi:hypothetical protein